MKHHKSVFTNEQELLKAIIDIHLGGEPIEADFTYYKGNFYKAGIPRPKFCYDIEPLFDYVIKRDTSIYYFDDIYGDGYRSIIIDPPFMFGVHGKTSDYYSSKTHGIYESFSDLEDSYIGFLRNAYLNTKRGDKVIFKCQDYTDNKTIMTHNYVWKWAIETGFYAKDLAILVKPNKVYNSKTTQRHLRKIHTYFYVFERTNKKEHWYKELENSNLVE